MRVRIVLPPKGIVDGVEVDLFHCGTVYDLPASLADLLILEGWAEPEMRRDERRGHKREDADRRSEPGDV